MTVAGGISVVLVDDDPEILAVLESLLDGVEGIAVVGTAADSKSGVKLAADTRPDVAVVDFELPGGGERTVREIVHRSPTTHVVAFSGSSDPQTSLAMLLAGAGSYLVKGASPADLVSAVVRAARGETTIAAEVAGDVMGAFAAHLRQARLEEAGLREARDRIGLVVERRLVQPVFQPILELDSLRLNSYEALCRFPSAPAVPAARWFSDAGQLGLRTELEIIAAEAALAAFRNYRGSEGLAVNASPDVVAAVAERGRWLGARLTVEVTEHAAIEDYKGVRDAISPYRGAGVTLAVDDAGAGFASFRHVLELKPDSIKLDVSLVRQVDRDPSRRALARGLVGFAHELKMTVVAEGVETKGELETLRELGADLGQGWLLGRPGPLPSR